MKPKFALRSFLAITGSSLLAISYAHADTIYWDGPTATWNLNTNWTTAAGAATPDPVSPPAALDDVIFNRTGQNGNNVIYLDADQAAQSLTFSSTGTTTIRANLTGTTARTLSLGSGGITLNSGAGAVSFGVANTGDVNVTLTANQTWTNNSINALNIGTTLSTGGTSANVALGANQLTIAGTGNTNIGVGNNADPVLTGSGALVKNGTGVLSLGGVHTVGFSGDVTINGGMLNYGDLPTSLGTGNIKITNGILQSRWTTGKTWVQGTTADTIQITGGVSGFASGSGATFNIGDVTWGSSTFDPTKFAFNHATSASGANVIFSSNINLSGATRTITVDGGVNGTARAELSGSISGTGASALVKEGSGILVLTRTGTGGPGGWAGATTVTGGLLHLGAANLANIGGGSGRNISVASGAGVGFNVLSNAILNRIVETTDEISVMTGTTSNAFDFSSSTGATLNNAFLGTYSSNGAKAELSGLITMTGVYRLGGPLNGGTLGITQASLLSGSNGLIVGNNRVVIVGTHTFTGDTTIRDGAILGLSGLNTDTGAAKNNSSALQNSVLDLGAPSSTGQIFLEAGTAGGINGLTTVGNGGTTSATFGGLKGSRNLYSAFRFTGAGNNTSATTAVNITGFTLNTGTGVTVTYSGSIGGFGTLPTGSTGGNSTLTKTGDGTQELGGANTYSGVTTISGGTLKLGHATALGSGGRAAVSTGETTVATGATLDLNGITGVNEPVSLSGDGFGANGALVNNSASPAGIDNGVASLQLPGASTGSGYSAAPTVTITGAGSGATAVASLGVTDTNFTVNVAGTRDYTVAPTITIGGGGGGSGATATPILSGGATGTLTGITITNPGSGYTTAPTVSVAGGTPNTGTLTSFTGNALNFTVGAVAVTAAGSGYTGTPTYSFDSGDATPGSVIVSSVVLAADSSIGGTGDTTIAAAVSESGGARNLTKVGAGTVTLSGTNTYSGDTTVTGGTLSLGAINTSNELSTVTIGTSAIMNLTFAGTDTVNKLFIGATEQPAGIYGHSSTGANNGGQGVGVLDARFAIGSGTLTVSTGSGGGPTGYAAWQAANGNTAGGLNADHDNDGVSNGVEYFLGGNTSTSGFTALPGVTNNAGTLSVTWNKAAIGYAGNYTTDFVVETSDTLIGAWTTADLGVGADTVEITGSAVKYTFPSGTKKFARLKVTGP